jgi:hypothetical protein
MDARIAERVRLETAALEARYEAKLAAIREEMRKQLEQIK